MRAFNMFSSWRVNESTYIVTENYLPGHRCVTGVIVGEDRVLVIDAGLGLAGDLREYIEALVGREKPVFCICTHGHTDCVGGAARFEEVYMAAADIDANPESFDRDFCMMQLGMWTNHCADIEENGRRSMTDNSCVIFKDLHDGDSFDLGGARADIMSIPGHTPGSVAVRVVSDVHGAVTFCGDAFGADLNHFHKMTGAELLGYSGRLKELAARIGDGEPVFSAHSPIAISRDIGFDVAAACEETASGMIQNDAPFDFGFQKRSGEAPDIRVHFYNNSYIVYNADML